MVYGSETEQGIFEQVLKGELDFVSEPWPSISESAKDLVRRMLVRDPKKRLTAHEVLCEYACLVDATGLDLFCKSFLVILFLRSISNNLIDCLVLRIFFFNNLHSCGQNI